MNNTIIQENSGINSFYVKVYYLVGMGIGISSFYSKVYGFVGWELPSLLWFQA